mgnify:FL=1|tara:strand:+ start:3207 stop:3509 length:303 start_codon:yes stop_codon:yes gene_type:complete
MITKENAHQYLPLIQALQDGGTLQRDTNGTTSWVDTEGFASLVPPERYRIKPEPIGITIWVNDSDNKPTLRSDDGGIDPSKLPAGTKCDGKTVRLFREVL